MPKVMLITNSLGIGGAERQLTLFLENLPSNWQAKVICFSDGPFKEKIEKKGIKVSVIKRNNKYDIKPLISVYTQILEWQPDIIHSWSWFSSALVIPICKLHRIPLVDGSIRIGSLPLRNRIRSKIVLSLSDRVIANSKAGLTSCKISTNKGFVVYNGIDLDRFPLYQEEKIYNRNQLVVIMLARMVKEKNFNTFIQAAYILKKSDYRGWRFIAAGNGPTREFLINYAKSLSNKEFVEFPDLSIDVSQLLMKADIGVLLTNGNLHKEGLSNSIMEYMISGLPVICSKNGGNEEIVEDQKTGIILNSDSVDEVVNACMFFKNNPLKLHSFGAEGKKRVIDLCSVSKMVSQIISIYDSCLNPQTIS